MGLLDHLLGEAPASPVEDTEPVAEAPVGREQLLQHIGWINENLSDADPLERAQATLHAFSEHFDDLDPEVDGELIRAGENLFRTYNPEYGNENE